MEKDNIKDAVEIQSVSLSMTRASDSDIKVPDLANYVGRREFSDGDTAVFTTIKRKDNAIAQFTYKDIQFRSSVTVSDNLTSVGWSRVPGKGTTAAASSETAPDRIYWSDATSPHTFIGYCVPQQESSETFDWKKATTSAGLEVYYGSLGNPTTEEAIDYCDSTKLCRDDILLTYSDSITAEDAIARLQFHHGLAQVRVIVNISDFAAGGDNTSADKKTVISNMELQQMLTMYKWNQVSAETVALGDSEEEKEIISTLYAPSPVVYNKRKNVKMWMPKPSGSGEGANKIFTFYALAVPTTITADAPLSLKFNATYPNPMNSQEMQTKLYGASISNITFSSGKCTTISISLNHQSEKVTVGASYEDWDFAESPDQGALKKNSTFLSSTARSEVSILGDEKATADDATWLYVKDGKVLDIYGNDGSESKPFTISTANQLLSFAYEVKGTERKAVTSDAGLTGGWDFSSKYVKLDADIHLQSLTNVDSMTVNKKYVDKQGVQLLNWIGIGDADHPFNGKFVGGGRNITHLYGKALFSNIGGWATVSEINLSDVVRVTDHGALAENNAGFFYACRVEGEVSSNNDVVGSLCGTNSGFIFACIHNGSVKGTKSGAKVGGLLGTNNGRIAVSYHTGEISGSTTYGVVDAATTGSMIYACYYNSTLASPTATVDVTNVQGRTLGEMQSRSFAETDLNAKILALNDENTQEYSRLFEGLQDAQKAYFLTILSAYEFVFTPGAYPRVQKK